MVFYAPYMFSAVNEKCPTAFFDPKETHRMFSWNFRHGKISGDKVYFLVEKR